MFYTFMQNNSGGRFQLNDEVCYCVIVEAASADEANNLATNHGIYFHGCNDGRDCSCCGDRWYAQWRNEEGTKKPEIYGKAPIDHNTVPKGTKKKSPFDGMWRCNVGEVYCRVYYKNGKVVEYKRGKTKEANEEFVKVKAPRKTKKSISESNYY